MDGFYSFCSNLLAVLVYYFRVGDVGSWAVVGNAAFVNCIGDMIIMFFYCLFSKHLLDSPM